MTEPTAPSAPPAVEKAGMLEDYIDIFIAPTKVFARRVEANAFVPFLIVTVLLIGLFYASRNVMEPIFDQEISRQLAKMAKDNAALAKPEAMESARKMMNISFQWGAVIGMPILLLGLGIIVWIVGKLFGATATFGTAMMITCYAWVPRVLSSVLTMVQLQLLDPNKIEGMAGLSFGPARFLDADATSLGLMQLAMRFDLFTIWTTVLIVVGLVSAGKMPKSKAVPAGLTLFVVGSLTAIWALIKGS